MFVGITNTPRDYAWGSRTDIGELLGRPSSGLPEAEYWLGTHPGSPSSILDGPTASRTLAELTTLPFIMKVLAADTSLSLQAHPSPEQAEAGFARENALGIPADSPTRNYKDALHKPELLYALKDGFVALCGFRPVARTRDLVRGLGEAPELDAFLARLSDDSALPAVFEWLMSGQEGVAELRARLLDLARVSAAPEFRLVLELAAEFPGDPGILTSLLLNLVTMREGQVIYLPAGNIHAYQRGLGIEVLAASDNVLRGGLTPKHVDVAELLSVVDFRPLPVPFLAPEHPAPGVTLFRPDVPDFELAVVRPTGEAVRFRPAGESLLLSIGDGDIEASGATGTRTLRRGDAAYVSGDEGELTFVGSGTVFVAAPNDAERRSAR